MNAAKLRAAIKIAAANAIELSPDDQDKRAAYFVSALCGRTSLDDPALSAAIWRVLYPDQALGLPTTGAIA